MFWLCAAFKGLQPIGGMITLNNTSCFLVFVNIHSEYELLIFCDTDFIDMVIYRTPRDEKPYEIRQAKVQQSTSFHHWKWWAFSSSSILKLPVDLVSLIWASFQRDGWFKQPIYLHQGCSEGWKKGSVTTMATSEICQLPSCMYMCTNS